MRASLALAALALCAPLAAHTAAQPLRVVVMEHAVVPILDGSGEALLVELDLFTGQWSTTNLGRRTNGWGNLPSAVISTVYVQHAAVASDPPPGDYLIARYVDANGIEHTIQTPIEGDEKKARDKHRRRLADSVRDYPPRPIQ